MNGLAGKFSPACYGAEFMEVLAQLHKL